MRRAVGWVVALALGGCAGSGGETGTSLDSGQVMLDESCDGLDDDLDGLVDEDGPCERCDGTFSDFAHVGIPGTDEDEDGSIDEGFDANENGVPDCQEDANAHVRLLHFIIDPTNTDADIDDDGINDAADVDITGGPDADEDGIDDRFDATVLGAPDLDGDGIADAAAGSLSSGLMLPVDISVLGSGVPVNPVPFPTFASTGYTRFPPATYSVQLTALGQPAQVCLRRFAGRDDLSRILVA